MDRWNYENLARVVSTRLSRANNRQIDTNLKKERLKGQTVRRGEARLFKIVFFKW
jgi:hypothetical protein